MATSPLHETHQRLGARFTDFGGWTMPLQYRGVLAEHAAVRGGVGLFDVSHLGRFTVEGPGALDVVRSQLCNDVARIAPGRAQYTMALNERGGVEDDIIVWWIAEDAFWVMPNGTNFDPILERFRAASTGARVEPIRDHTALLAVQGPDAPSVVEAVLGAPPGRFRLGAAEFAGAGVHIAGTGYTGEKGVEAAVPVAAAEALWEAFVGGGAVPCGLGARDTLRLEMGYPLWGQDLDPETTPLEAGLGWVVSWDHDFVGRDALMEARRRPAGKQLVAFRTAGRAIPRHGYRLRAGGAEGTVTSGNFSPVLGRGIGMGYVSPPPGAVAKAEVEIRGEWVEAEVVIPPFVDQ